ncbi:unnamed protein product [Zymoseptoria tritici ST99CH_1A5]|nr:unnamed protein product [Zymoseptoria tritici ST99CH_3D7]SMR58265.1 unnamed protein product [Zymoseptoria tritici ST99CH_1E4]SMR61237.1 unnamed protein product [Zymoseptoria tritici ST99CH_3D1]SMY27461.1 unnamed protein product [Zymoseptoria tritici ST99CH_1A5]
MATTKLQALLPSSVSGPKQAQDSQLTSLAPELRNRIYALVFVGYINDALANEKDARSTTAATPGLILACKQFHQEALGIFYSHAGFQFCDLYRLSLWKERIGKARTKFIHHVRVLSSYLHTDWFDETDDESCTAGYCRDIGQASDLEIWYRTGWHHDKSINRKFYLWTRDPLEAAVDWKKYLAMRRVHIFALFDKEIERLLAQIARKDLHPSWILDVEHAHHGVGEDRWDKSEVKTFWSTS